MIGERILSENISILIADDHLLVRQGFKKLLERQSNITVLNEEVADGEEALLKTLELSPDILLLDINMPKMNGFEVLESIRAKDKFQKVIMLTIHDTREYISESIVKGANGYISKDADISLLTDAIVRVYNGESYIQPTIVNSLMAQKVVDINPLTPNKQEKKQGDSVLIDLLTPREIEVLKFVTEGMPNKEIASKLGVAEKTIRNHLYNIFKKIDVTDRTQAAIFALENKISSIEVNRDND